MFCSSARRRRTQRFLFPLAFERSLENETLNLSHQLAMRKLAIMSFDKYHQTKSMLESIYQQAIASDDAALNVNSSLHLHTSSHTPDDEDKRVNKLSNAHLCSRCASKDG